MKSKVLWGAGAAALGAGLMALLDPQSGKRRRAVIRDRSAHLLRSFGQTAGRKWRDLSNRRTGAAVKIQRLAREEEFVTDEVLQERVRAKIGRLVTNPHSIVVTAHNGVVTLTGPVLEEEVDRLLRGVRSVRGASGVENSLEVHSQPDQVPGLQGVPKSPATTDDGAKGRTRRRPRRDTGDGIDRGA